MKEKSPTELYFDEIINEIHQMLKPLGFEKKDLNFYREQDFFRQIFNIELWHSYSKNYILFTINIGTDYSTDENAVFDDIQYFRHRENINDTIGDKAGIWYELNGEMLDKSQINAHFLRTKNFVLAHIKTICQTLFKIIKDET